MTKVRTCLLIGLALLPTTVLSESGFYVGAAFGGTRLEQDIGLTVTIFTDTTLPREPDPSPFVDELSGTDAAFKFFGGYQFGDYIAIEGGYIDLGEAEDGVAYTIPEIAAGTFFLRGNQDREIESSLEIDGWIASLVGIWPINDRVEVFGKAGFIGWDGRRIIQDRIGELLPVEQPGVPAVIIPGAPVRADGGAATRIDEDDGTDLAVGAGVTLNVTEQMSVRGEFEWFDIDDTDVAWLAGFAVIFKF